MFPIMRKQILSFAMCKTTFIQTNLISKYGPKGAQNKNCNLFDGFDTNPFDGCLFFTFVLSPVEA